MTTQVSGSFRVVKVKSKKNKKEGKKIKSKHNAELQGTTQSVLSSILKSRIFVVLKRYSS